MQSSSELPPTTKKNIAIIAQVEQQLLRKRSRVERVGKGIAQFFGSAYFIVTHVVFIAGWILLNTGRIPGIHPFDPFPFAILALAVGIESILLTTFVLFNQRHQIRRTEQWWHLHLQLSMLTEQEVTKNMQMLALMCRHLGLEKSSEDQELSEMIRRTSVTAVVGELAKAREMDVESVSAVAKDKELEDEFLRGAEEPNGIGNS